MKIWRPLDLVGWTTDFFRQHGVPQPRLDAEVLLAHVLGCQRIQLYADFERPVVDDERARYRELVRARATERIPVAYLTGVREFWSLPIRVEPGALIPRPETELLVQQTADLAPRRVLEIGVGSGAVLAALAHELPRAVLFGVECAPEALRVAAANLERLGVAGRVHLLRGDLAEALSGRFDAVIANPPYVPSAVLAELEPELAHEPRLALDGGPDGLDVIRRLIATAPRLLGAGSALLLEIGDDQRTPVECLLYQGGAKEVRAHRDLADRDRVLVARFGNDTNGKDG